LKATFGGEIISTFPFKKPSSLIPRSLYGLHNKSKLIDATKTADIVHVFSPVLHAYRYLRSLKGGKKIYSILTPIRHVAEMAGIDNYVVYDNISRDKMQEHFSSHVFLSPPFVDFPKKTLPRPDGPFTLLMASAPWEKSQFESKGIDLLLQLVQQHEDLQIIFIWRDVLYDEMQKKINQSGCAERITLINERVDISTYLMQSHAVVLLSKYSQLVKSYPHSLLEGILAGRPIITTSAIPIHREIESKNLGVVMHEFDYNSLEKSVETIRNNYEAFTESLQNIPETSYGKDAFLTFYENLYLGE